MNILKKYLSSEAVVEADQITGIENFASQIENSKTLSLAGGKVANMAGKWIMENHPEVGGYFVIDAPDKCRYVNASDFESSYRAADGD